MEISRHNRTSEMSIRVRPEERRLRRARSTEKNKNKKINQNVQFIYRRIFSMAMVAGSRSAAAAMAAALHSIHLLISIWSFCCFYFLEFTTKHY